MPDFRPALVPENARTLPREAYCSEAVFAREQERLFTGGWICAGRSADLAQTGDFLNVQAGTESVLVVRGADGGLRGLHNVCRHRGTRLCEEGRGRFRSAIQCPYHAWTYGLDGRLLAARMMDGTPGFRKEDYPLQAAAVAEWEGFVFLHPGPDPEPFEAALAPLLGRFTAWGMGGLVRGAGVEYDLACNWKLIVENYSECYHCPPVHPALCRLTPADSGRNDLETGPVLGGYMELNPGHGTMSPTGRRERPPLAGLPPEEFGRVYYYAVFPNLLLSLHPDYVMSHLLWPEGPARTRVVCEWHFHPDTVRAPGFDPSDAVTFWDQVNREDWHVCELSQLGIASLAYTPGPYAHAEGLLWAFDEEYRRRMEDGRP